MPESVNPTPSLDPSNAPSSNMAREASLLSRKYVHSHKKAAWLALFSDHAVIEDPIGPSYLDPAGLGHRTPAERETFWDRNIAQSDISITIHQSYSVGSECANHVTLVLNFTQEGQALTQEINGVFTYATDSEGKITALRGYWEPAEATKTLKPAAL